MCVGTIVATNSGSTMHHDPIQSLLNQTCTSELHFRDGCTRVGKPRRNRAVRQRARRMRPLPANSSGHPSVARHLVQEEAAEPVRINAPLSLTEVATAGVVHTSYDVDVTSQKLASVNSLKSARNDCSHDGLLGDSWHRDEAACATLVKDDFFDAEPRTEAGKLVATEMDANAVETCDAAAEPSLPFEKERCDFFHEESKTGVGTNRRVTFDLAACSVHEITPYSEIYGLHPRDFVFDRGYYMVPAYNFMPIDVLAAKHWAQVRGSTVRADDETEDNDSDSEDEFGW